MPVDKTQYTQMPLMSDFAAKIRSAATSGLTSPEPTINAKTIKPKSSSSGRGGFNNMDP